MGRTVGLKVQLSVGLRQPAGAALGPFNQPQAASLVVIAQTQHLQFLGLAETV